MQEYPKWIPTDDGVGIVVFSKNEEDGYVQKQKQKTTEKVIETTPAKRGRPKKDNMVI